MYLAGFSCQSITWFESYLPNRRFQVNIKTKCSNVANINCRVPQGSILGPLLFLPYVNDMPQAVDCKLFLYADGSCLIYQHRDAKAIETKLNNNFSSVCNWFVDNKLSIHFGEDKTKCILFGTKKRLKKDNNLNIRYGTVHIKQYHTVSYLGCVLDENLSGEPMALQIIKKIKTRLRFLYRKNRFLSHPLRRLLCNAIIQPHFDYGCSAYLNKSLKKKLQTLQNKCICFCLNLNNRDHIGLTEFEKINWLPINNCFEQCISSTTFNFFNNRSPAYMNDVFKLTDHPITKIRASFLKLIQPSRNTNYRQKTLSYLAPNIRNSLPVSLKVTEGLNT